MVKTLKTSPAFELTTLKAEPRVDSRLLAKQMHKQHQSLFELVKDHRADFEQLGKVRFETGASPGSKTGQTERFALLNEDASPRLRPCATWTCTTHGRV